MLESRPLSQLAELHIEFPPSIAEWILGHITQIGPSFQNDHRTFEERLACERTQWKNNAVVFLQFGKTPEDVITHFETLLPNQQLPDPAAP